MITHNPGRTAGNLYFWILIVASVLIVVAQSLFWYLVTNISVKPMPPIVTAKVVDYDRDPLCPGDILHYSTEASAGEDVVVGRYVSIWKLDLPHQGTILFETAPRYGIVLAGESLSRMDVPFTIPLKGNSIFSPDSEFVPGHYELRSSYVTEGRGAQIAIISIPFTIREDCGAP